MAEKTFSPVRARAATQEAAITQALQMTGASRDEIEIEVIEENEKGVTIRIAPIGTAPSGAAISSAAASQPQTESEAPPAGSTPEPEAETVADEPETESETVETDDAPQAVSTPEVESAPEAEGEVENDDEEVEVEVEVESQTSDAAPVVVIEADAEVIEHARAHAQEMLDHMGLEAQAKSADLPEWCLPTSHEKSERVRDVPRAFLSIEGEDIGILIGKQGQTLQSFQYLLNLSLNNTAENEEASSEGVREGGVHVVVDAGDYRGRRAETVMSAALDGAERAKRDRRSVRLEPMPAHERRLAHLALHDDKTVHTSSEGREPWRRVVVTPDGVAPSAPREERGGGRYNPRSNGGGRGGGRSGSGNSSSGGRSYGSGAGGERKSYN